MKSQIARKVVNYFRQAAVNEAGAVLWPREKEIPELLSKGFLYKEIATKTGISTGTVRQHIHKFMKSCMCKIEQRLLIKRIGNKLPHKKNLSQKHRIHRS